ncbi:hypothetical protein LBMAG21_02400 [Armatimonadota bacterium]|nr:hypothetical protein LBMAG21_02400 [Armatimonadota bacterium]
MKKMLIFAGALCILSSAAMADGKKKTAKAPTTLKCAVMSTKDVNIKDATASKMFADYKGNRYFFCCGGCPDAFKADPAKYASAPHIATPKEGKKKKA